MTDTKHTKGLFAKLADKAFMQLPPDADAETIRDLCDQISGGDLDTTQLDILSDMVGARLKKAVTNPLEWKVSFYGDCTAEVEDYGDVVLRIIGKPYIGMRAARLIAAAPELLEALKDILAEIKNEHGDPSQDVLDRIEGISNRAIAKAEGGAK